MSTLDNIDKNLERIATVIEKAVDSSNVEIEIPPPQCPNCKRINPTTQFDECQVQGPFAEYLLLAHCMHCKKPFFGIPILWVTTRNRREAEQVMNEHLKRIGLDERNTD